MKKVILTIATAVLGTVGAEASTVWAPGAQEEIGDYRASKVKSWSASSREQDKDADGMMCWAAAASDLIAYWQQRYETLTGTSLAPDIPHGSENSSRRSAVFDAFVAAWDNRALGVEPALYWYFSGAYHSNVSSYVQPGTGGYWAEYCANLGYGSTYDSFLGGKTYWDSLYTALVPGKHDPDGWYDVIHGGLGSYISTTLSGGALLALDLKPQTSDGMYATSGHYVTLYGAEYDDEEQLVGLWVHDNNSSKSDLTYLELTTEERWVTEGDADKGEEVTKYRYEVFTVKGGLVNGWVVNAVESLKLEIVPEPASSALALSVLAALATRRRRKE